MSFLTLEEINIKLSDISQEFIPINEFTFQEIRTYQRFPRMGMDPGKTF